MVAVAIRDGRMVKWCLLVIHRCWCIETCEARMPRFGHENVVRQDQPCNTRRLLFRKFKCEIAGRIVSRNYFELKGDSFCRGTVTRRDAAGCFFAPRRVPRTRNGAICILQKPEKEIAPPLTPRRYRFNVSSGKSRSDREH